MQRTKGLTYEDGAQIDDEEGEDETEKLPKVSATIHADEPSQKDLQTFKVQDEANPTSLSDSSLRSCVRPVRLGCVAAEADAAALLCLGMSQLQPEKSYRLRFSAAPRNKLSTDLRKPYLHSQSQCLSCYPPQLGCVCTAVRRTTACRMGARPLSGGGQLNLPQGC
eukprot:6482469-Amphidinium_carterae.1